MPLIPSRVRAKNLKLRNAPDSGAKKTRSRWHYMRQYWAWLKPTRWQLLAQFGLALLAACLDLIWPLLIKQMIEYLVGADLSNDQKLKWLILFSAGVVVLLIVKQSIELFRSFRTAIINAKLLFRLRRKLFGVLLNLPLAKLGEFKSGGVVSRLGSDVDSVSGLIQQAIISPAVSIVRIFLTFGVLLYLSWQLATMTLIALPPVCLLTFLWIRKVRPIYRSMIEDKGDVDARVAETFGGVRVVRAFRREKREAREYGLGSHTVIRKNLRANRAEYTLENAWGLLIPLASLIVVAYGGYLVINGKGKISDIFVFQIYSVMLLGPVIQIIASVSTTQKSLAAMERVFDAINEPLDKPDKAGALPAPKAVQEIRFEHVNFGYRPDVPILHDLCLTIPGGSTVALVGPSGAGKTTFTDLVCRFHDPVTGSISLNGHDLRDLQLASYRSLLAVVQQETFLFDGTVHDNIAYGKIGATREDVIQAAQRANAHTFITAMPEGYDTPIGERGFKLSGGQRQRLSIARAMLADPKILILDEATSNLDTESEQLIQAALSDLLKDRTTFVIAHRLSTIANASLILVLEAGHIIEQGTHDELLIKAGVYAQMVERQRLSMDNTTPTT